MAQRLSFDTSFLIDFQRERARGGGRGPAHDFLRGREGAHLCLSAVALGEFTEGFDDPAHEIVRLLRDTHEVLPVDEEVALVYAGVARKLRRAEGQLIGANDLWIAATALRYELPLVAADREHFGRVPALQLRTYR
jgi:tRNA(fMet)-specific endonuclease VapC